MKTIHKYTLAIADEQTIRMPKGADVLRVDEQNGALTIWAMVFDQNSKVNHRFAVRGTGHPCDGMSSFNYVGTVVNYRATGLVWHVFDMGEAP